MKLAQVRTGAIFLLTALLQSCGAGGGDGSGVGSGARMTLSDETVSATATPGQSAPIQMITLTVSNPPADGIFIQANYSDSGIERVDFAQTGETQGTFAIVFRPPGSLPNGTYSDTLTIRACTNQSCTNQIRGSPATVATSYDVSGDGVSTVTLDRARIHRAVAITEHSTYVRTLYLSITAPPPDLFFQADYTNDGISSVTILPNSPNLKNISIMFRPGIQLTNGTHADTITISACYDSSCTRHVQGSPLTIETTVEVSDELEPGLVPLVVEHSVALPHDIVDAEFSKALNQIVMVGTYPRNALYVYDVATGVERSQPLNKVPTTISVSPDGLTAAVGHDALITVIDLPTVGQPGAPTPIILDVNANAFDLVLDGHGSVHVFPRADQWTEPHSIEIATNIEQLGGGILLNERSHARLHPSGDYIYTADNGISPSDIQKWDVTSGVALGLYDSPYHGDYDMCGDLWFDEPGTTIYTACGNSFNSSSDQALDMTYSGALKLSHSDYHGFRIKHLSQSETRKEIALIEDELTLCFNDPPTDPCFRHLAFYESDFLNRLAVYSIKPLTVNGTDYDQIGLFVFYDAIGPKKYLLSKLENMPDPDAEYYVSVVP